MEPDNRPSKGIGIPVSTGCVLDEANPDDGDEAEYGRYDFVRREVNSVSTKEEVSEIFR